MERVKVIGTGPGGEDYLLPVAKKAVEGAQILVGGKKALELFRHLNKEEFLINSRLERTVAFLQQNREKKIAVLVSGDPGLYSLLDFLLKHFSSEEIEVIPGLSSVQLAFARAGMTWQETVILSLHGRDKELVMSEIVLPAVKSKDKVALLTDHSFPPQKIADYLLKHEVGDKKMMVGEDLSCPEERFIVAGLEEMVAVEEQFSNCVVLIIGR